MPSDPVTSKHLFECQNCGECCKGYGGTFVTEKDIEKIAAYLGMKTQHFVDDYCQLSGGKPILAQGHRGYCAFWDEGCTIHAVKPQMCRQWPFIPSVLIDIENWQIMAASCPGMRTDLPDKVIRLCVSRILEKNKNSRADCASPTRNRTDISVRESPR